MVFFLLLVIFLLVLAGGVERWLRREWHAGQDIHMNYSALEWELMEELSEKGSDAFYRERGLLYVNPDKEASREPLIDDVTRRMTAAIRHATSSPWGFGGTHPCSSCSVRSTAVDYVLPEGMVTNSLCVHYLAYHREAVSAETLARVQAFPYGELYPDDTELCDPHR